MSCEHISNGAVVKREIITQKHGPSFYWTCSVCQHEGDNWLCLYCGDVFCGKDNKGHADRHAESNEEHCLSMNCEVFVTYCFACDNFIEEDSDDKVIGVIRKTLQEHNTLELNMIQESAADEDFDQNIFKTIIEECLNLKYGIIQSQSQDKTRNILTDICDSSDADEDAKVPQESQDTSSMKNLNVGVVGLRNLGNTCFLNAVLQSLSIVTQFSSHFNSQASLEKINSSGIRLYHTRSAKNFNDVSISEECRKVLINLRLGNADKPISPVRLCQAIWRAAPRFTSNQQQDAHEFLRYLLNVIHNELQEAGSLPDQSDGSLSDQAHVTREMKSIVTNVFGGVLQSEVRCRQCGTEFRRNEQFLDLSLDIPNRVYEGRGNGDEPCPICNIVDCLSRFTEMEDLAESELYECSLCKSRQPSTKKLSIMILPNVLCLHIKIFRWDGSHRSKMNVNLSFPLAGLDMSQFVLTDLPESLPASSTQNQVSYDLVACVVHHGSGTDSGHYTAFGIKGGQWFDFDDSRVRPVDAHVVASCKPYILFYSRSTMPLKTQN